MRSKEKPLTFNERTMFLFSYHEGFTEKLRSIELRMFQDNSVEYHLKEFQKPNRTGFTTATPDLLSQIQVFLDARKEQFTRIDFPSMVDDMGFGSIQCRFSNSEIVQFRLEEPVPEENLSERETELIALFKGIRDFSFSLFD